MAITADQERQLLTRYNLSTLYPDRWPHDDNDSTDDEDTDLPSTAKSTRQQSTVSGTRPNPSKYRSIDRHASVRSAGSLGPDSVVQKDEADPLGVASSVAAELRRKGLPVEEDLSFRNRFMLSSTSFSPALFLSQMHQDADTRDLLRGLEYLGRSIEQKSASLKVLVESNFERFVRAKAVIDNVYTEMRTQGADPADASPQAASAPGAPGSRRPHSRHTSRSQAHFRNTSGPFSPAGKTSNTDKKKNALTKESEYGVLGIRAPLQDLSNKADEVWGPALGGREKEDTVKSVLTALEQHREIFRISSVVNEAMRAMDYDTVVEEWKKANRYANQAREIANIADQHEVALGEQDAQQIIVTAKMWHDVSAQVETFKRDIWKRLKNSHGRTAAAVVDGNEKEEHMELIGVLLQLGVDENPIWQWLHSRYLYLRDRIVRSFERLRIEIEIIRRRLAANDGHDVKLLAKYLRSTNNPNSSLSRLKDSMEGVDLPTIVAFWERVQSSFTSLLSSRTGVQGEVVEFWETAQSFINNEAQKSFPNAVFTAGLEHLQLDPDDIANLRQGAMELVTLIRENTLSFFADAPVEDLSDLYSPIPPTPITPDSAGSSGLTPSVQRSFSFDPNNVPPPSPKRGDAWEKFAFWAPHANSLSGSYYLSRILALVGTAASELANLSVIRQTRGASEHFKTLVTAVRERCVQAVCAAWVTDAERCKYLEDWVRLTDRRDLTCFPNNFASLQEKVLGNFQRIAYISEGAGTSTNSDIITPPPAKLLQAVRGSFVTTLYKVLSGMVENAEKGVRSTDEASGVDADGIAIAARGAAGGEGMVDASNRNIRMLMTLSNLAYLRTDTIPHLTSQFETSFSVKLTDESKTIRDVLGQIDARLFQSYVKPTVDALAATISAGITSEAWEPKTARPTDARPYVYDVLLTLVLAHSEVSTTASTLTNQLLSYLLEQSSLAFLAAFKSRRAYSLPALMQATLDVEFMAQTLNNYTTDRAGEVQSQIYLALDEKTDDEARKRLQGELPEMRAVLKKLREGTKGEFGCFKRERRGRSERAVGERGSERGNATAGSKG